MPRSRTRRAHCPACRNLRIVRTVGTATVGGQAMTLTQCRAPECELIWATPAEGGASHGAHTA